MTSLPGRRKLRSWTTSTLTNILFIIMKHQNRHTATVRFGTPKPLLSGNSSLAFHGVGDRRTVRTHILLRQALFALMAERDYDGITVQDILDRANVGRSTFYMHFSGKDELLKVCLEMFRTWLFEAQKKARTVSKSPDTMLGFTLPLFEHLSEQRDLFRRIVAQPSGAAIIRRELEKNFTAVVRRDLANLKSFRSADSDAIEPMVAILAGALYSLATWWLAGRSKLTARDLDDMYRMFAFQGFQLAPAAKRVGTAQI
jgi:AcrR family transcriptional regulator